MQTATVPVSQLKRNFSELIGRVCYQGARALLTRQGKIVAALVPAVDLPLIRAGQRARRQRQPGRRAP
jgi:prevent-host-death family protein